MKIPDKVKIGPYTYSVELTDGPIIVGGRECNGSIEYENLKIRILNKSAEQIQITTFLHEVYHGIVRLHGIAFRTWDDEEIIDYTAIGWHQVIIDNPEMFSA